MNLRTLAATLVLAAATVALSAGPATAQVPAYTLTPAPPVSGWYRGPVEVRFAPGVEHRMSGAQWSTGAATVTGDGVHTLEHRKAGETTTRTLTVRIDTTRPTLNRTTTVLRAGDALSGASAVEVRRGMGRWTRRPLDERLFDGTRASLDRWRHAGAGGVELTPGGALRTVGGIGLLWYAARQFGDAVIRLQWREGRADMTHSNGGVFVRFPPGPQTRACDIALPLALNDFTWHAVACGNEIQINDGAIDPQQTGSVYGFRPLDATAARPAPFGTWNDYEIRITGAGGYEVQIVRNGYVLNRWVNELGQHPVQTAGDLPTAVTRAIYPPSDLKQQATGLVGIQNHGAADTIEYRDIRVLPLGERTSPLPKRGRTATRIRAVDAAGNRSPALTLPAR